MFEVGKVYIWGGDIVNPYFKLTRDGDNEYAENGFKMLVEFDEHDYVKDIITPEEGAQCKCVGTNPLVFEVGKIVSPLVEDNLKKSQRNMVRRMLEQLVCGTSDLEVNAVMEAAIPWTMRFQVPSIPDMIGELVSYLKRCLEEAYTGSVNGHASYKKQLTDVLTVLFGSELSNAIVKLKDIGKVTVEYNGSVIIVRYNGVDICTFLDSVKLKVQAPSSPTDPMRSFLNAASKM